MTTKAPLLPVEWPVPDVLRDRLGDQAGRQRAIFENGHLLLVLHKAPKHDDEHRDGRFFWRSPDGVWHAVGTDDGLAALAAHIDLYARALQHCDIQEERATSAADYYAVLQALAPIVRATRNMHQALQEARKACPLDRELIDFRDRANDLERTADLLQIDTKNALEFTVARRTEQQAEAAHSMALSSHRLNVLAAYFFPIATLSAIFGVNLQHGYEHFPAPNAFLTLVVSGLVGGVLLRWLAGRALIV